MIDRMSDIVSGVCELARAETEILLVRARTTLIQVAIIVTGLVIATLSVTALLVALTWTLANEFGLPIALTIVGAIGLTIALGVFLTLSAISKRIADRESERRNAEIRAEAASAQIKGEEDMDTDKPQRPSLNPSDQNQGSKNSKADSPGSLEEKILGAVMENPGLVAGGALTVISVLGPMRTIRLLGRTTMLAGLVSSALSQVTSDDQESTQRT